MEISLLKTLGQVAGIGGISLGVFFLLLRYFIHKNIFPKLSNERAYRLLRQFQYSVFVIAATGMVLWTYGGVKAQQGAAVYRVRITILSNGNPINSATVWSSVGGESKRISGGYEIDIPRSTTPTNGRLTVFAEERGAFMSGKKEIILTDDLNPAIVLELIHDSSGFVRGMVRDKRGNTLANVRISLPGYNDVIITSSNGVFVLPAHVSVGQQVQVHAQKAGYKSLDQWHPAGDEPAVLVLEKDR